MRHRSPRKINSLLLICIMLSGMLVMGAFQNCSHHRGQMRPSDTVTTQPKPTVEHGQARGPASDLGDMLKSSESDIRNTRVNLNENMKDEGGIESNRVRQVATDPSEFDVEPIDKKDAMKIKLKTKRRR